MYLRKGNGEVLEVISKSIKKAKSRRVQILYGVLVASLIPVLSFGGCSSKNNRKGGINFPIPKLPGTGKSKKTGKTDGQEILSGDSAGFNFAGGLETFKEDLHPFIEKSCGGCHGKETSPLFATDKAEDVMHLLIDREILNCHDSSDSRIVTRLIEEKHNCPSDCDEDGEEMKNLIDDWLDSFDSNCEVEKDARETAVSEVITDSLSKGTLVTIPAGAPGFVLQMASSAVVDNGQFSIAQGTDDDGNPVAETDGVPTILRYPANGNQDSTATFNINVETAGDYYVWTRMSVPNDNSALQISIDGGANQPWNMPTLDAYAWNIASADEDGLNVYTYPLTAGAHTVAIASDGNNGTRSIDISRLVVSKDKSGVQESFLEEQEVSEIEFDLKPKLKKNAKLFVHYSVYSDDPDTGLYYQIHGMRLETTQKMTIEGMEVYINGEFPDKEYEAGKTWRNIRVVADSAGTYQIVGGLIKGDKGISSDKIGFGFYKVK